MTDQVLPIQGHKSVGHMNAIGLIIALGIAVVLLPILPLLVLLYLLGEWEEERQEVRYTPAGE